MALKSHKVILVLKVANETLKYSVISALDQHNSQFGFEFNSGSVYIFMIFF